MRPVISHTRLKSTTAVPRRFYETVLRDPFLPQQAIYSQPAGVLVASLEVAAVAAPAKGFQRLIDLEEPGPNRIPVDVIAHRAQGAAAVPIGVNLPVGLGASLFERGNEPVAVIVVPDDIVALIAAVQNVLDGSGVLEAQLARHTGIVEDNRCESQGRTRGVSAV